MQQFNFALHFFLTALSWFLPFLVRWEVAVAAYSVVLLQFFFFNRCLMNEGHALSEENDMTFYAHLMEKVGIKPNYKKVKGFVRSWIYVVLASVALLWQVVLGNAPLWF